MAGGAGAPQEALYEIQRRFQMGVITQPVAMRLEQFFQDTGANFDGGAWGDDAAAQRMSAMAAIDEVHSAARDRGVRNPSAYFTGIARKHLAAMQSGQPYGPGYGYGGAPDTGALRVDTAAEAQADTAAAAAGAGAEPWTTRRCSRDFLRGCFSA